MPTWIWKRTRPWSPRRGSPTGNGGPGQNAIARTARRGHRALILQRSYPAAGLARRVVTVLAARGRLTPARSRPGCRPPASCQGCA